MRSIELFSGCGGLAFGLSVAGFTHEAMVEWDGDAVNTVMHNRKRGIRHVKHWPIIHGDVQSIDWRPFATDLSIVAGGPPCQPFSIGGKHMGQGDARDMWPEAIRAVSETLPRAFLFENVKGLARPAFAHYLSWITERLSCPRVARREQEDDWAYCERRNTAKRNASYDVLVVQVNAADYGAPQKRNRVIVAGVRRDLGVSFCAPAPTHSRERLLWDQWVSGTYWKKHGLAQPKDSAIARMDLAMVKALRISKEMPATLPWVTVRDALVGLGAPTGKSNHVFQDGARAYAGHTGSPLDKPAKALKAGDHGVPGGENMMVRDDGSVRYFTIREAARLQGLPDTYQFPGSWSESMRQLGNAVPTQLSASVGRWMASFLYTGGDVRVAA